jgi:hypothetical protein
LAGFKFLNDTDNANLAEAQAGTSLELSHTFFAFEGGLFAVLRF